MTTVLMAGSRAGLRLLWESYLYAQALECDVWEFAVEWPFLEKAGMTINDLRWLVHKGLADHGRDVTGRHDTSRKFRKGGPLLTHKRTCLTLTDHGAQEMPKLMRDSGEKDSSVSPTPPLPENGAPTEVEASHSPGHPKWDFDRHELRLGTRLVKRFKLPSPNQEAVLMAFEEASWPARIDDPLPPSSKTDAKKRLHDTIKSLNRHQTHRSVRFRGDGRGTGVRWEPMI